MAHDPCAICSGTGAIRCSHCGGSGINRRSSLLDDECYGCKGMGTERCQECRGTGEWHDVSIATATYSKGDG